MEWNQWIVALFLLSFSGCQEPAEVDTPSVAVQDLYREAHRPQFHFSPPSQWANDPNGLVYFEGEYHLFYQHYPDSNIWGPMHWGHAVSHDLIHWQNLPIALFPDSLGYIFSGSAVIDRQNTSELGMGDVPPMIAIFTHHDTTGTSKGGDALQTQSLAYSIDKGRSWAKYKGNPVLENPGIKDFRDPKVIWHEKSEQWIMVLAVHDRVHLYRSPNLIDWTFASEFGLGVGNHEGVWECPDLFPLKVDTDGAEKWVLIQSLNRGNPNGGSGTQYFVGDFDGQTFTSDYPDDQVLWLEYGKDNYAGVTWSNAPNGGRIFIGWMSNWEYAQKVPTRRWRNAMTLPRTLHLQSSTTGNRLITLPTPSIRKMRKEAIAISRGDLSGQFDLLKSLQERNGLYECQLEFEKPASGEIRIELFNGRGDVLFLGYSVALNEYFIDRLTTGKRNFHKAFAGRHTAPCYYSNDKVKMHLFIDHASIELFADDGKTVMTEIFFIEEPFTDAMLHIEVAPLRILRGRIFSLQSIWEG